MKACSITGIAPASATRMSNARRASGCSSWARTRKSMPLIDDMRWLAITIATSVFSRCAAASRSSPRCGDSLVRTW